jgi:isochorismate synthase
VARLRVRAVLRDGEELGAVRAKLEASLRELTQRLSAPAQADAGMIDPFETRAGARDGRPVALATLPSERPSWDGSVERVLSAIAGGRVRKVVLARTLQVRPQRPLDPLDVLEPLWKANRTAHVFYFEPRPGRVLLGAAPETIATLRRGVFHATAVAGSTRLGANAQEQGDLAAGLMASEKDRAEHQIAVEDMVERLGRMADDVRAEQEPHVLALPVIQHLETAIRARVSEGTTVLDLVAELHPTPAVCGDPREEALETLASEEPFERGWYAGPVGWFDVDGNGMFAPALRSAVLADEAWRLYAGAGIVAGSHPEAEWVETGIKLEPMLRALSAAAGGAATGA